MTADHRNDVSGLLEMQYETDSCCRLDDLFRSMRRRAFQGEL